MTRPTVEKKAYDQVVENAEQLVAAIEAAQKRNDKNVRYRIFISVFTFMPEGYSVSSVSKLARSSSFILRLGK